jgi:ribosomal 50S subunit-associated protein YjgA (DUF615 family)
MIKDENGEISEIIGVSRSIERRKAAELKMLEQRDELLNYYYLAENSKDVV